MMCADCDGRLSTVDAEGWPHASLLSAGDMLALPHGRIRLAIHPTSGTAANLVRDGKLTLTMTVGRGLCELWMWATKLGEGLAGVPLAFFEARLQATRHHEAPSADVTSGVTFSLHDPGSSLPAGCVRSRPWETPPPQPGVRKEASPEDGKDCKARLPGVGRRGPGFRPL